MRPASAAECGGTMKEFKEKNLTSLLHLLLKHRLEQGKLQRQILNRGVWLRNFTGFWKTSLSMAASLCPRFFISSAVFGTASGSLTPQSQAQFIQIRSL